MLDYQVKYWANQEQKRANLAQEAIGREKNRLTQESNEIERHKAETSRIQAAVAQQQADTAKRLADISYMNAQTDQYAKTVQANAALQNAWTNAAAQQSTQALQKTQQAVNKSQVEINKHQKDVVRNQNVQQSANISKLNAETDRIEKETSYNHNYKWPVDIATNLFNTASKFIDAIIPF